MIVSPIHVKMVAHVPMLYMDIPVNVLLVMRALSVK